MRLFRRSLIALGALSALAMGCARHVDMIKEPFPDDQAALKTRVHQIFGFAQTKKLDDLDAAHLYGPKFTKFDDWEPLTKQDAAASKKGEREAFASVTDFKFTISDFKADVFKKVGITTFVIDYSMMAGKDKIAAKARGTMVFVKDGGQWKITHEHFSPFKSNP